MLISHSNLSVSIATIYSKATFGRSGSSVGVEGYCESVWTLVRRRIVYFDAQRSPKQLKAPTDGEIWLLTF